MKKLVFKFREFLKDYEREIIIILMIISVLIPLIWG